MRFQVRRALLFLLCLCQLSLALERQSNSDYRARRQALTAKTKGAMVLLFAPPEAEGPNDLYGYRPDDNFFYLSGWSEPGAGLLITGGSPDRPYTEILFLPAHNPAQERWTGPKLGPENPNATMATGFDRVEEIDNLGSELIRLLPAPQATVYTDVAADEKSSHSQAAIDWLKRANAFPLSVSFHDVRPLLASLRTYKDAGELERIRKATEASIAGHLAAMRALKPGITEHELSALLQYEWGKRGCARPSYAPIVGAGFNSTVLHYSDDSGVAQTGDVVVIDAAGEYAMYASDITRTLPVNGKFTARQREIYDIVLGAQQAAIKAFQSGKSHLARNHADSLYDVAFNYINSHGKDLAGQPLGRYFIHGLGHYVGLNVHDEGDYEVPVAPGMVFTIEPGIYIPEEKLGVRIEDIFYVEKDGRLVNLTSTLPHTAEEVEHAMSTSNAGSALDAGNAH
jgi:Xaa-Pro aminopeptidase